MESEAAMKLIGWWSKSQQLMHNLDWFLTGFTFCEKKLFFNFVTFLLSFFVFYFLLCAGLTKNNSKQRCYFTWSEREVIVCYLLWKIFSIFMLIVPSKFPRDWLARGLSLFKSLLSLFTGSYKPDVLFNLGCNSGRTKLALLDLQSVLAFNLVILFISCFLYFSFNKSTQKSIGLVIAWVHYCFGKSITLSFT